MRRTPTGSQTVLVITPSYLSCHSREISSCYSNLSVGAGSVTGIIRSILSVSAPVGIVLLRLINQYLRIQDVYLWLSCLPRRFWSEQIGFVWKPNQSLESIQSSVCNSHTEHCVLCGTNCCQILCHSGPMRAYILAREDAIRHWRELMGPTKVFRARYTSPASIRAQFGLTDTRNTTHGSGGKHVDRHTFQYARLLCVHLNLILHWKILEWWIFFSTTVYCKIYLIFA